MSNSNQASPKAEQVLKELLEELDNDNALESHLPKSVTDLDKAALLAVIYRLMAHIK